MTEHYEAEFLKNVAQEKGITPYDASNFIYKCIEQTALKYEMQTLDVYHLVHSPKYLEKCLRGKCEDLTLDECQKSCHCVTFEPVGCISRRIEDAELINADPDKYVKEHIKSTKDIERLVQIAAFLYHNYDGGGLTDNSFDALEYHLKKRLSLKGRLYEKIGAPPVEKIRTTLPYLMPSLNKVKPNSKELTTFLNEYSDLLYSLKLDGVSGMIIYKDRKVSKIYTRGDGVIGGDVTYLKDLIKSIPQTATQDYIVRGEFIIKKNVWKEKYEGLYANARSFVSAKINSGFVSPYITDIEFVAYEIMKIYDAPFLPPPFLAMKLLSIDKFKVVKHDFLKSPTVFELINIYKSARSESEYYIDGLVLVDNRKDTKRSAAAPQGTPISNPTDKVAFKMRLEEQIRKTKVLNVEWNISRYGKYIPVAIYESVYIDGVRLHRATAHNAAHIRDWNMGIGTEITVVRSGDVIPTIIDVNVDDKIEAIFPPLKYPWHWEKVDIILDVINDNRDVQIKRIVHFFETIGVPKLREKTAEKMWEAGMKLPEDIARASSPDFQKIKGIGKKTADFFFTEIHKTMRTTPIDRYLEASTTLNVGIGRKLIKTLFRYVPDVFSLSKEQIIERLKKQKIPGFGPKRIENIADNIPKFREYLYSFAQADIIATVKYNEEKLKELAKKGFNSKIKGKTFVLTGFYGRTDYELEDYIYDNQGDFSTTVTSKTEAVVSANILDITKKMDSAYELKIPVLTLEEFSHRYDVPLKRFEREEEILERGDE